MAEYSKRQVTMTKRPEPVPAEFGERDALLATKLHLPQRQPGFVSRQRLLDRLDDALANGLTLVCAPAGFGKTALLADWIRSSRRSTAWLSLDAADSDPARFWQHAVAALDRARPGIAARVTPLLGPPAPPSFDGLVTALINELATAPTDGELLLVLDDYHMIDSPTVHASLMFLLDHLPRGLHVVLATRADPPLALARLRVRGILGELRTAELRFTAEEAASLLREAGPSDLPPTAAAALATRTEGWGAGLRLAALSLRGQPDVNRFVATFSGSHRYVLDYLTEEVLEHQTEPVREFLLETSVLERLSGDLSDAVTGRTNGQAMLETIEAAGLFLVPLDEVRGWWRYHHLFADLLRIRLQQERPGRVAQLHRNAANWYEEHDLTDEAVRHAVAAGETSWAAQLTEQHFDELFYLRGERATVQRWLSSLPAELIRSRPRLLVAATAMADSTGNVDAVDGLLDAAELASADAADEPFEPSAGRAASLLVNVPATIAIFRAYLAEVRGDAAGTAAAVSRALAEIGEGESMLAFIAQGHQAVAEWLSGRLEEAERALSASIGQWQAAGLRNLIGWGSHHLGQIQFSLGRLEAAEQTFRQTLESTVTAGRAALPAAGVGYAGLAEVAYQRNELDGASRLISEGVALCRQFSFPPPLATALSTLAWIRQAQGDPEGALEAMGEAERVIPGPVVADLLNPVPAQRARLLLAQGDTAAAERWTRARAVRPDDEPSYPSESAYLVLVRVLLAQGRPTQALPLLQRIHAVAGAQRRTGSVIEVRALQALALAACGDDAAAADVLAEALTLGRPDRHIRVFVDEGAPMQALLERVVREPGAESPGRAIPADYLAPLLSAFGPDDVAPGRGHTAAAAVPGLVEPLTPRETEVLGLLAAGKSNSRIAEELVVTLDTVKKHVSHILDKLDADNRTAAVTRGRTLGLIA
jgi:LuxR family maltose regulon positive regulatory protein